MPLRQTPLPEQSSKQLRSSHASPVQPGSQKQSVPLTQRPWREQSPSTPQRLLQSSPLYPMAHVHFPSWQTPAAGASRVVEERVLTSNAAHAPAMLAVARPKPAGAWVVLRGVRGASWCLRAWVTPREHAQAWRAYRCLSTRWGSAAGSNPGRSRANRNRSPWTCRCRGTSNPWGSGRPHRRVRSSLRRTCTRRGRNGLRQKVDSRRE